MPDNCWAGGLASLPLPRSGIWCPRGKSSHLQSHRWTAGMSLNFSFIYPCVVPQELTGDLNLPDLVEGPTVLWSLWVTGVGQLEGDPGDETGHPQAGQPDGPYRFARLYLLGVKPNGGCGQLGKERCHWRGIPDDFFLSSCITELGEGFCCKKVWLQNTVNPHFKIQ